MADQRKGLLLGAGASYELGMPLVWGLTNEIRDWLTPEKFRSLNGRWQQQNGGYPYDVGDAFLAVLRRTDLHYENIIGYLETEHRRPLVRHQHFHGLFSWLTDLVYQILYLRHVKNKTYIESGLAPFEGLRTLAEQTTPLWVFTLNHDLLVEMLALRCSIPVSAGLPEGSALQVPRRATSGEVMGHFDMELLRSDDFEERGFSFLPQGTMGINLFKLHGSLDMFTTRDGKDLCRIRPTDNSISGLLDSLHAVNEEAIYPTPFGVPLKVNNEVAYADDNGEMQFLRRTILSGAFKFHDEHSQVLPKKLLDHFRSCLNYVHRLIVVGYGFGDDHVNKVIRRWLEFSRDRSLLIVDPMRTTIPEVLKHVIEQVELQQVGAADFFAELRAEPLSVAQKGLLKLRAVARKAKGK